MCEFVFDSNEAHRALSEEAVMLDDEHANNFGGMVVHLLAARAKRCLWYYLPPVSMAAMLSPDATVASQSVTKLLEMWEDYQKLMAEERPNKVVKEYLKRHPCQQLAVKQLVRGFEEGGWTKDNTGVYELLHQRFSGLLASQLVEDINNQQKNWKKQTGWGGRYRRPETSMYAAVDSHIVSKHTGPSHSWLILSIMLKRCCQTAISTPAKLHPFLQTALLPQQLLVLTSPQLPSTWALCGRMLL